MLYDMKGPSPAGWEQALFPDQSKCQILLLLVLIVLHPALGNFSHIHVPISPLWKIQGEAPTGLWFSF